MSLRRFGPTERIPGYRRQSGPLGGKREEQVAKSKGTRPTKDKGKKAKEQPSSSNLAKKGGKKGAGNEAKEARAPQRMIDFHMA